MSYNNPYSSKTSSPSQVSTAKRSFLKDSSWIKKDGDDDDDSVFQDKLAHKTGSVSNLTKRFGGSQDLDQSRNQTSSKTVVTSSGSGVKTTTSTIETKTVTPTKPALQTKPPLSPGGKSSFTDRVFSANKPDQTSPQSTTTTTTTVSRQTTYTETTNGVNTKILSPSSTVNTKILSPTSPVNIKSSVESAPKSPAPVPIINSKTISSVTESPSPTLSGSKSPSYKSSTLDNLADTLIDIPTKPADTTTVKTRTSITRKESEVDSIPARHLDSLADTLDPFSSTTKPQEKTRGRVNTNILSPTSTVNTKILSPTSPVNIKSSVESAPKSPAPVPITSSKTISSVTESPSPTLSGSKSPSYKSSTLDNLADTLIDIPTKPADTTTVKTRTSITKKGSEVDSIPARHLDSLADTLDPFSSTTKPQEKTRGSSYDSLSDSLLSSPTKSTKTETSYTKSTKYSPGDTLISSKTSPSVQSMSKRTVSDRNVCSFCHQPITESIRMVLDELKIFSHADCFKCVGCHCKLSKLEAGDSLWVYRDAVNCDNCYMKIKDRWYH
ncbi:uncharacterized protein LOC143142239 isoform X2 [Alosa pseudoharengus]|uniref:uncharacterized protein LOC143142239 isoform X2 n=1 Tax=Alosa pseudoharengus TaxID=34774 RepID=UPI003F88F863